MNHVDPLIEHLYMRLRDCFSQEALDRLMTSADVFRAFDCFPENPSSALALYALNRELIRRDLPSISLEELTQELLYDASVHLAFVYLRRIGFLIAYEETAAGTSWCINPLHPFRGTIESLKIASPALYRFAQVILKKDRARLEKARDDGFPEIDLPPRD